jgi:DNA polymerase III epsilon subunit-like protein
MTNNKIEKRAFSKKEEKYNHISWFIQKILNSNIPFHIRYVVYLSLISKNTIKQLFVTGTIRKDILKYFDKYTGDNLCRRLEIECEYSTDRLPFQHTIWNETYSTNDIYMEYITMIQFS